MRASNDKRPCQEARAYYYDLLCPDEADVPPSVRWHIAACSFCRERMDRLRETLFALEQRPDGSGTLEDEMIETLAEQFRLLDQPVTCPDARSCLPQLAMATPQIRIPTPITVHVDHCSQCAEDLAVLRKLQLSTDQLRRLSQLFASRNGGEVLPWPAEAGGAAPVGPRPTLASPGREALSSAASGSSPVDGVVTACHNVSATDIFDAVVPAGTPLDERQKAMAAHIQACPVCLGRAQELHHTISRIVERPDSKIETVYHAAEDAEDAPQEIRDAYQYPVSVEVVHAGSGAAWDPNGPRRIPSVSLRNLRGPAASLVRVAVVSIVVVALAALVRTTVPTASGTNAGHVRQAVEKAPNVRVVRTNQNAELVQELLIDRRSDRLVNRTREKCVVYDLGQGLKQIIGPQTGIEARTELSTFEHGQARRLMAGCLLDVLERISPDTQLHPPVDDTGRDTEKGLDVYELRRSQRAENSLVRDRWWAYIDPVTGLPQKTETYQRGPSDPEWRLLTTTVYTYPTEQEMDGSIRALLTAD